MDLVANLKLLCQSHYETCGEIKMRKALLVGIAGLTVLVGCNGNSVGQRGNWENMSSTYEDIRAARRGITVFKNTPMNASSVKEISVQRCHELLYESPPSIEVMEDDLVLKAYAYGADGISEIVHHKKEAGLLKSCWHIRTASAKSFRLN